jgi:hypothetical protein
MAPEEYRDWLDKKLYNEPSLYERLIALASEPPEEVVRAVSSQRSRVGQSHN